MASGGAQEIIQKPAPCIFRSFELAKEEKKWREKQASSSGF